MNIGTIGAVDWSGIGAIAGVGIGLLLGGVRLIIKADRLQQSQDRVTKQLARNTRHIQGVVGSLIPMSMRVGAMEDHLAERDGYKPPSIMPNWPFDQDRSQGDEGI